MNRSVGYSGDRTLGDVTPVSKCMKENDSPLMAARGASPPRGRARAALFVNRERGGQFHPARPVSAAEMTKNEIQFIRRRRKGGREGGDGEKERKKENWRRRSEKARRSEDMRSEEGG